ncbi:hypothetical protein [Phytohabitans rumicis]|uniref:Uncharacterized protein n=1 Tax=Phytohabitans rumicis TaxID=1076125 RepID=A0A6V8KWX2_9ACTN|nr:hypothetical protein [Phytohabitans rumicis]GFJ86911.1 hypothetical protein Prum_005530 [Phytohabitans rumicis]
MITRRILLGAAAGAGALALTPTAAAAAAAKVSANGWPIDPTAIATYRVEGSAASVALRRGPAAAVLLHIARRWHYEIAPVDTGEGGGIAGHTARRAVRAAFETNYLSGTAIALHPTAYPVGGSERLWPHHEAIVRDILVDCAGTVVWGGDLSPATASHFHVAAAPRDRALARVADLLDPGEHAVLAAQTAGTVADPATPDRRERARRLPRPR